MSTLPSVVSPPLPKLELELPGELATLEAGKKYSYESPGRRPSGYLEQTRNGRRRRPLRVRRQRGRA
jgi:hypothetical protein